MLSIMNHTGIIISEHILLQWQRFNWLRNISTNASADVCCYIWWIKLENIFKIIISNLHLYTNTSTVLSHYLWISELIKELLNNSPPFKSRAVLQTASVIQVAIFRRLPQKQFSVLMRSSVNGHTWLTITCFYLRRKRTCMVKTGTALDYNTEIWSQGKRGTGTGN